MNTPKTKFEPPALDAAWLADNPLAAKPHFNPERFANNVEAIFKRCRRTMYDASWKTN